MTARRAGLRIMLPSPDPTTDELAELTDLARSATGKVVVEDSYSRVDMSALGLLAGLPITLTGATAGKPLYDSLGFTVINKATWWL